MKARISAVILLREDGAALMQHRDNKPGLAHAGCWVPPGGHGEWPESAEDTARREFLEETGYRCGHLHFLLTYEDDGATHDHPQTLHVYWAEYDGVQPLSCFEGQALDFVPRSAA